MMMMYAVIGALCLLQAALATAQPQLITLRDGKVGVNFAGFHADAGLGGLLTGDSTQGFLSASAGTPWGARSAAGLGGDLNGRAAGVAYAAAQANPSVGASAVLAGNTGEQHGYAGSEAHAHGKTTSKQHSIHPVAPPAEPNNFDTPPQTQQPATGYVQRVKPPKKYSLIKPESSEVGGDDGATSAVTMPAPPSLIIVKRQRLRAKRPHQKLHQRVVYVSQQQEKQDDREEQEQVEGQVKALLAEPAKADESVVKVRSEAKETRKYIAPAHTQTAPQRNLVAQQANGPVGNALQIPIGILQSLQYSLDNLLKGMQQG